MNRLVLTVLMGALMNLQAQTPPAPAAPPARAKSAETKAAADLVRAEVEALKANEFGVRAEELARKKAEWAAQADNWHALAGSEFEAKAFRMKIDAEELAAGADRLKFHDLRDLDEQMMEAKAAIANVSDVRFKIGRLGSEFAFQIPPPPPGAPRPMPGKRGQDEESVYRSAKSDLEDRDWDDAIERFQSLIDRKGKRADASMFWKAYVQHKQGRKSEALSTLGELQRSYPGSRWLDDAKALEVEVKQSSGQPVSPESEADEDIKVLALNGLIHSDPERSVPMIEKLVQRSPSPRLKERALFVLAQSRAPQARTLLLNVAKGSGGNPDLQTKAIEYLGMQNMVENRQVLVEIYQANNDVAIRRAVLRGLSAARDKERLLAAAKSETNPDLRREAIRGLGSSNASEELWQLYAAETSPELKVDILRAIPDRKENADKVVEYVKTETDLAVRSELIRQIGYMKYPNTREMLPQLYSSAGDPKLKSQIINALRGHGNATGLIAIAKSETDPKLKRNVIEALSNMKNKEATDYLMEMLNK